MNRDEFEHEFRSRTIAYLLEYRADRRPVVVQIGDDANTPNGHLLLVGLVNQLARAHQHLIITNASSAPLLCPPVFGLTTVQRATIGLARAINPFITASIGPAPAEAIVTIGIGHGREPVDLRVGCDGWCATFGSDARIDPEPTGRLGAMLASCLSAAYAFHRLLAPSVTAPYASHSLWNYGAAGVTQGPEFDGALDIGRVLQVGAGGVGASLDYWLALIGLAGSWTICDGDAVDVTNLNRQLAYLAMHAGYPAPPAINKAEASAVMLRDACTPDPHWYGETLSTTVGAYDVVLALANDRGVRGVLQARQPPVLLHATTSPNWEAQFHRHIAGRDDCIACRIPEEATQLRCATAPITSDQHTDAALPFLSASAGLLLLAALVRLQLDTLADDDANYAALNLRAPNALSQQLHLNCIDGCTRWAQAPVRHITARDTRYAHLDTGAVPSSTP